MAVCNETPKMKSTQNLKERKLSWIESDGDEGEHSITAAKEEARNSRRHGTLRELGRY